MGTSPKVSWIQFILFPLISLRSILIFYNFLIYFTRVRFLKITLSQLFIILVPPPETLTQPLYSRFDLCNPALLSSCVYISTATVILYFASRIHLVSWVEIQIYRSEVGQETIAYYSIKMKSEAGYPHVIDYSTHPRFVRTEVAPTARQLLMSVAQKLCRC
jgi:hypothetical protein